MARTMASKNVDWILVASLLISFVLISAEASSNQAVDELVERLLNNGKPLKSKVVEAMLQGYENQQHEILGHSVEKLVGICKLSTDNCSRDIIMDSAYVAMAYYYEIPNLFLYVTQKRYDLERFCIEHYRESREKFLTSVGSEDVELVRSFVGGIEREETSQRLPESDPVKINTDAYLTLLEKKGSADEKGVILSKLERFFNQLAFVCSFEPKQERKALSSDDLIIKDSSAESTSRFVADNMRYLCFIADDFEQAAMNVRAVFLQLRSTTIRPLEGNAVIDNE